MADAYSQTISGGVATTLGQNTKRIFPTSEMGTPKITPVILHTNEQTLPSGESAWTSSDTNVQNYLITSEYQTQGDVFLAVQSVQQFCTTMRAIHSKMTETLLPNYKQQFVPH
jgi:hypothetical protein